VTLLYNQQHFIKFRRHNYCFYCVVVIMHKEYKIMYSIGSAARIFYFFK